MADFQDNLTTITVGGLTSIDEALGWFARTVLVSNYTNQYVSLPDIVSFVPPYTERLLALPGVQKAKMLFASPPGTKQVASIPTQVCNAVWSERSVPVTGGPIGPIGVTSNYYDRNPTSFTLNFVTSQVAPHAMVTRASYTVPANRKAFIEFLQAISVIETTPGDLALGSVDSGYQFQPSGGTAVRVCDAYIEGLAPIRTTARVVVGGSIEMQPGDMLIAFTFNTYTATQMLADLACKGTEFDA